MTRLVEGGGVLAIEVHVRELDELVVPRLDAAARVVGARVGVLEGGGGLGAGAKGRRLAVAPAPPRRLGAQGGRDRARVGVGVRVRGTGESGGWG